MLNVVNTGALCMPKVDETPKPVYTPVSKRPGQIQTAFIGTMEGGKGANGEPAVTIRFYKAM
jgi:hypothetical protein